MDAVTEEPLESKLYEKRSPSAALWVATRYGNGRVLSGDQLDGPVEVQLPWGRLFCRSSQVELELDLRVFTFAKGNIFRSCKCCLEETIGSFLSTLCAPFMLDCKPEEVRLVHHGRELPVNSNQLVATWHLSPPYNILVVIDEKSTFSLDPHNSGEGLEVRPDGLSALITSQNKWRSVRGSVSFTQGRHYWDVTLDRCQNGNVFLGVGEEQMKLSNYCGACECSFGYYGAGNTYRRGGSKKYGQPYRTGDVIRVLLDLEQKTLSFAKNGQNFGVAFHQVPSRLYPVFSLYTAEDSFSLTGFGTY